MNHHDLYEAADICHASGRELLGKVLRDEADRMRAEEMELKAPFNLTAAQKTAISYDRAMSGRAAAVVTLRRMTGRSLRACMKYVNEDIHS